MNVTVSSVIMVKSCETSRASQLDQAFALNLAVCWLFWLEFVKLGVILQHAHGSLS